MPLRLKDQIYATVNSDAAYNGTYKLTFPNKAGTIALTSDIPSVPTVNNGQLTIQKNGTNVQTFTANQSGNVTANITVPTKTSDLTNDSNFVASTALATVATSGSYNDLSNKPTIPAAQVQSNWTQTTTTAVDYIKNKPTLATVATSGSYNDLSNKPTIPTVNNATLTIQKNGTNVETFTANASSNKTANIIVPTKTSDITNDSGFIIAEDIASTSALTPPVTTGMIANGAVTNDKIDWSTMAPSGWTTLNSTYGTYYAKYGNIVFLRVLFRNVTATSTALGTLPAAYRPAYDIGVRNAYDNQQGLLYIPATGSVVIQWTGTAPSYFFAMAVYPVDQ